MEITEPKDTITNKKLDGCTQQQSEDDRRQR